MLLMPVQSAGALCLRTGKTIAVHPTSEQVRYAVLLISFSRRQEGIDRFPQFVD